MKTSKKKASKHKKGGGMSLSDVQIKDSMPEENMSLVTVKFEHAGPKVALLKETADLFARTYTHQVEQGRYSHILARFNAILSLERPGTEIIVELNIGLRSPDKKKTQNMCLNKTLLMTDQIFGTEIIEDTIEVAQYVFDGKIVVSSDEHCPACWSPWLDKETHTKCNRCGAEIEKDILLIAENADKKKKDC